MFFFNTVVHLYDRMLLPDGVYVVRDVCLINAQTALQCVLMHTYVAPGPPGKSISLTCEFRTTLYTHYGFLQNMTHSSYSQNLFISSTRV